ncbi:MAG TPA: hypothetical protein VF368_05475, partial [Gemmatimonadaceae bacterium]
LSFEFSLRVDSSTLSTTLLPAGIIAPSDPDTEPSRTAVKRSPGLKVLVHTRATGRTPNEVPALTVPIAGAGGTFEVGAPAPVAAADDGEFALGDASSCALSGRTITCGCAGSLCLGGSDLAASAGFGFGLLGAAGVGAAAVAGASFNWGCAGALGANCISRAGVPLLCCEPLSPHAVTAARHTLASNVADREVYCDRMDCSWLESLPEM